MRKFSYWALPFLFSLPAFAVPFKATIYELNSNRQKALFNLVRTETEAGGELKVEVVYTDPSTGKVAIKETGQLSGEALKKYVLERIQTGKVGTLDVRDGKAFFSLTAEGKTETDDEKADSKLVVGLTLAGYIQKNWNALLAGNDVEMRYASVDRKETVGFKLFQVDGEGGDDVLHIRMKPSSFVIAALVKPLTFSFDKKSKKLLYFKGRTIPQILEDGKWKDLDGEVVYTY